MSNFRYLNINIGPVELYDLYRQLTPAVPEAPVIIGADSLNTGLREQFTKIGVTPLFLAIYHLTIPVSHHDGIIVTDYSFRADQHAKTICGFSWQLDISLDMDISWWDVGTLEPCLPYGYIDDKLTHAHYGHRNRRGVLPGARCIETVKVNRPILYRMDVPHMSTYKLIDGASTSICLYFQNEFESWEHAVKCFDPVIDRNC